MFRTGFLRTRKSIVIAEALCFVLWSQRSHPPAVLTLVLVLVLVPGAQVLNQHQQCCAPVCRFQSSHAVISPRLAANLLSYDQWVD